MKMDKKLEDALNLFGNPNELFKEQPFRNVEMSKWYDMTKSVFEKLGEIYVTSHRVITGGDNMFMSIGPTQYSKNISVRLWVDEPKSFGHPDAGRNKNLLVAESWPLDFSSQELKYLGGEITSDIIRSKGDSFCDKYDLHKIKK